MGKIKPQDVNTPADTAEDEDDLLLAEDGDGNAVSDDDVIAEAMKVETLRFTVGTKTHKIEVQKIRVPARLTSRIPVISKQIADEVGFDTDEDEEDDESQRDKLVAYYNALMASEPFREIWAEISVAATVKDEKGRYRTSVPHFRTGLSREALCNDGVFGPSYIQAVKDFLRPGSTGSQEATETTSEVSGSEPSKPTGTTSTEQGASQATSSSTT